MDCINKLCNGYHESATNNCEDMRLRSMHRCRDLLAKPDPDKWMRTGWVKMKDAAEYGNYKGKIIASNIPNNLGINCYLIAECNLIWLTEKEMEADYEPCDSPIRDK